MFFKILQYSHYHALTSHPTALATLVAHPDAHLEGGENASTCPFNLMRTRSGKPINKAVGRDHLRFGSRSASAWSLNFPGYTSVTRKTYASGR